MRLLWSIGDFFDFEIAQSGYTMLFTISGLKDGIDDIVSLNLRRRSALEYPSLL